MALPSVLREVGRAPTPFQGAAVAFLWLRGCDKNHIVF